MKETRISETVEGGIIRRDQNNMPTGVFIDNAREPIPIPEPSEETL